MCRFLFLGRDTSKGSVLFWVCSPYFVLLTAYHFPVLVVCSYCFSHLSAGFSTDYGYNFPNISTIKDRYPIYMYMCKYIYIYMYTHTHTHIFLFGQIHTYTVYVVNIYRSHWQGGRSSPNACWPGAGMSNLAEMETAWLSAIKNGISAMNSGLSI